jgi:hypothetical protein
MQKQMSGKKYCTKNNLMPVTKNVISIVHPSLLFDAQFIPQYASVHQMKLYI